MYCVLMLCDYGETFFFFFFNDTATTEIYTLSLHDALPICRGRVRRHVGCRQRAREQIALRDRSEEHTSELQSPCNLVCRLLLEKKKTIPRCFFRAPDTALSSAEYRRRMSGVATSYFPSCQR